MMTKEIFNQIMQVRDTGRANMLDVNAVQRIANEMDFFDLVIYIEENRSEYANFIFTGKAPGLEDENE